MSDLVSEFLGVIGDLFFVVFNWITGFLFDTLGGSFINLGKNAYSWFYDLVSSSINNGSFFYVIFGTIIGFFAFKIVIRIIRG